MALDDVKPAFGAVVGTLETYRLNGIIDYGDAFRHLSSTCHSLVEQVPSSLTTQFNWKGNHANKLSRRWLATSPGSNGMTLCATALEDAVEFRSLQATAGFCGA